VKKTAKVTIVSSEVSNNDSESDSVGEDTPLELECDEVGENIHDGGEFDDDDLENEPVNFNLTKEVWKKLNADEEHLKLSSKTLRSGGVKQSTPDDHLPKFGIRDTNIGYTGQSLSEAQDYFLLFFCDEIMQTFIGATNAFAKSMRKQEWRDLTLVEFKTFLAIILHMGMVKGPSRTDQWSFDLRYGNAWLKSMMSKTRFEAILRCLHYMNTANFSPANTYVYSFFAICCCQCFDFIP